MEHDLINTFRLTPVIALGLGEILGWLVFGLIVGAIARFLLPGRQSMGIIMTIVLGIVGSFAGGFIASMFTQVREAGWIMSVVGAVVVLLLYGLITKKR